MGYWQLFGCSSICGTSLLDAALISSKQFFGLQLYFLCSSLVYLLEFNWFEQKKVHFAYSKPNLKPKNCLLEIGAANLKGPFVQNQTSRRPWTTVSVALVTMLIKKSCQIVLFNSKTVIWTILFPYKLFTTEKNSLSSNDSVVNTQ